LLLRKTAKKYNILIGDDPAQVRFAEQVLNMPCQFAEHVDDMALLSGGPCLLNIATPKVADLSEAVKTATAFWSLGPITRGSAGATAIVRHAASILAVEEPERDVLRRLADRLAGDGIDDIRIAVWKAVWLLLGPIPEAYSRWPEPWEDYKGWLRNGIDPSYRLNTLLRDLAAYAFILSNEEESLRKAGLSLSPSRLKHLKGLTLEPRKVYDTVSEISAWKVRKYDPYECAFRVATIWQK
jgi:hypothetical protein